MGAPFSAPVRYGDSVSRLPIADGSCGAVYCSHTLEHLARDDSWTALRNTYRILTPGGVFRLVVPDLKRFATKYLASNAHDVAAGSYAPRGGRCEEYAPYRQGRRTSLPGWIRLGRGKVVVVEGWVGDDFSGSPYASI